MTTQQEEVKMTWQSLVVGLTCMALIFAGAIAAGPGFFEACYGAP